MHYNTSYLPDGKQKIRYSTDDEIEYTFSARYAESEEDDDFDDTFTEPIIPRDEKEENKNRSTDPESEDQIPVTIQKLKTKSMSKTNIVVPPQSSAMPSARRRAISIGPANKPKRNYEDLMNMLNLQMTGSPSMVVTSENSRSASPTQKKPPSSVSIVPKEAPKRLTSEQNTLPRLVNAIVGVTNMKPPKATRVVQQRKAPIIYDNGSTKVVTNASTKSTPTKSKPT
jgi:hypothetical protein